MIRWILREAPDLDDLAFPEQLARRLRALGVPVDRLWLAVARMHPLLVTSALMWADGVGPSVSSLPLTQRSRAGPGSALFPSN